MGRPNAYVRTVGDAAHAEKPQVRTEYERIRELAKELASCKHLLRGFSEPTKY
jgi:hypothetical protein